jgi:DNA segregation ATPase FtsK/SpoIIIE-like protein
MVHGELVVDLLTTSDSMQAASIAGRLNRLNAERQDTEKEVKDVVEWLQNQYKDEIGGSNIDLGGNANNDPNPMDAIAAAGGFDDPGDDDDLYNEARRVVIEAGKASTSYIQRKLRKYED